MFGSIPSMLGLFGLTFGIACSDVIPPDPYLGTIDPGGFDAQVAFPTSTSSPLSACMVPRRGFGGASGLDGVTWVYLAGLSTTQLDLSNASDATRALPPSVYQVKGCNAPEGRGDRQEFDARLDNYLKDRQYPIIAQGLVPALAGAASEPARLSTYKPFHLVIPVELQQSVVNRMGCNDVKGERSLLERAGWSRETKLFPDDGPRDFTINFPSRDAIRSGQVTFKDWPMVSVAAPIMKTPVGVESCPFVTGNMARYPAYPGDPNASFQFPSQHWLRGLLGGYLDGGDVPTTTDPLLCPALVPTLKDCSAMSPCTGPGEVCNTATGKCTAPVPICPKYNDLYVAVDETWTITAKTCSPMMACAAGEYCYSGRCFTPPAATAAANPLPSATVTLPVGADPKTTMTRSADLMAVFSATPGQQGFSPVCRLRFFDKNKLSCNGRTETETVAPRPLCTAAEIKAAGAVVATSRDFFVHCVFPSPPSKNP
jgi:hypothetical protein